jgi:transposase
MVLRRYSRSTIIRQAYALETMEEWEPYKKMQEGAKRSEEIIKGQEIRGFKDKHRALMNSIAGSIMSVLIA